MICHSFISCWAMNILPFSIAALLSAVGSVCLMISLHRLLQGRPAKLLIRQLRHLAASNLLAALFFEVWSLTPLVQFLGMGLSFPNHQLDNACRAIRWTTTLGHQVARLSEVHIALACFACTCRCPRLLSVLHRPLRWLWLIAALLTTLVVRGSSLYWHPSFGCSFQSTEGIAVDSFSMVAVFVICIVAYLISAFQGRTSPFVARRRVLDRSGLYVLVAICTYGPFVLWCSMLAYAQPPPRHRPLPPGHPDPHPHPHPEPPPHHHPPGPGPHPLLFAICWTLFELNGAANAAAFL